jgi:nitrite reductase (NADH) small subunit
MISVSTVQRHVVCRVDELPAGEHTIIRIPDGREIGVYNLDGEFFAIKNVCPHHGGPLCLGVTTGTSVARFPPGGGPPQIEWHRAGEIVRCPWHGWEFDIKTGVAFCGPELRTATYPVSVGRFDDDEAGALVVGPVERFDVDVEGELVVVEVPS